MDNYRPVGGVGRGAPINQSSGFVSNTGGGFGSSGFGTDSTNFNDSSKSGFGSSKADFGSGGGFGGGNAGGFGGGNSGGFGGGAGGGGNRGGGECRKCGEPGHFARDCPQGGGGGRSRGGEGGFGGGASGGFGGGSSGFGGGGFGSNEENTNTGFGGGGGSFGRGGGGGTGDNNCRKCGEPGHFARDCPQGGGGGGPRTCHKCNQPGHIARDCPESGGGGGGFGGGSGFGTDGGGFGGGAGGGFGGGGNSGPRKCRNCNQEGHIARNCPEGGGGGGGGGGFGGAGGGFGSKSGGESSGFGSGGGFGGDSGGGFGGGDEQSGSRGACHKCGEEGHFARECPTGGGGGGACYNCGEQGHMSKDCPNPRKEGAGGGRSGGKCFRCNEEGHRSAECPNPAAEGAEERKPASTHVPVEVAEDALFEEHIPAGANFDRWYDIAVERTGNGIEGIPKISSFDEAGLTDQLRDNVRKAGYARPTPIQQHAIPIILAGRDLMGCAQTGSGKTAAFMLPILTAMMKSGDMTTEFAERQEPSAIVMVPTRELAIQIKEEARKFAAGTMAKVVVAYGGTSMSYQMDSLKRGCNVLVATPGRLMDIVGKGRIGLSKCKYLVLDEADRMLDMGFEPEVRKLVENSEMPPKTARQTLMFSATFPSQVQTMAGDFMNDHVFITIGKVGAANQDIVQEVVQVEKFTKKDRLQDLINADVEGGVDEKGKYSKKTMIFVERKRTADYLATFFSQANVPATSIHGDRLQNEREEALRDFRKGTCPILVATGVAARGLDIKGVDHVINYDLPKDIEDYVHRIGRTGRVGNPGRATSLYDSSVDSQLAQALVTVLTDAQQTVPDWLAQEAGGGGGAYNFGEDSGAGGGAADDAW